MSSTEIPAKLARMHTAEHLLSAVMRLHYGAPRNLEFHLGEKKTKCDYEVTGPFGEQDIRKIEALVNAEIARDHPVTSFVLKRDAASDYDLWKVPNDADEIRIYRIGDFDAQPCGGPHVSNTGEIGEFHILSYDERPNGRLRLRFKVQ